MFLEIIVFVGAILLGLFIYWRESRSNAIFRSYNAFINKKSTRMDASDRKGFFYLRPIQFRLLNALLIASLFGLGIYQLPLITQHLQLIAAFFVGLLSGTYVGAALPSVKRAVDNPMGALQDVAEAGKGMVSDLSNAAGEKIKEAKEEIIPSKPETKQEINPEIKAEEKQEEKESARDKMKRKGYLK